MLLQSYPRAVWSPVATLVVTGMVVSPIALAVLLSPAVRTHAAIATVTQLIVYPVILVAGGLLYIFHRATESGEAGWLALCLTVFAVQGTTLAGLRATDVEFFLSRPGWILVVYCPLALLILLAVLLADRVAVPVDPMVAGMLLGLLVAASCVAASRLGPDLSMTSRPVLAIEFGLVVVGAAIAHAATRLRNLPGWWLHRLAVGTVALVVNQLAISQPADPVSSWVAAAAGVTGAVCIAGGTAAALRWALVEQRSTAQDLAEKVAEMEDSQRDSRARLHEVTNSIAGIAAASSLIHRKGGVEPAFRGQLEEMLESEANRLARLLGGDRLTAPRATEGGARRGEQSTRLLEIDEVVRPLVTAQRALGRRVSWQPSGQVAVGDADAVAEVLSILLDNASRHAPGSVTVVDVTRRERAVEIAVRDDGPGIPAEVRRHLFQWGGRGPGSKGQGIGLHLAHQLMVSGGNSLRLDVNGAGTTFVVGLPLPPEEST